MDKFTEHEIQLNKGDIIYMFSDGYADQFGGPKGKKFKYSQFEKLILENSVKGMQEQGEILTHAIEDWKNNYSCIYEQTDDITVVGIKI
jgi:serine phosphatase RsbU (regulator of sigma subunit)